MSIAMIEKGGQFRALQAQYAAFITEQDVVTAQVISTATTTRLEALDLEIFRWEDVHKDEIKAFGGIDTFTTPAGPGVLPATSLEAVLKFMLVFSVTDESC
jgi:uncharacterized protein (UPF0218 family)